MDVRKEMRVATFLLMLFVACMAEDQIRGGYILTCSRTMIFGENNQCELCRYGELKEDVVRLLIYYKESYDGNKTLAKEQEYRLVEGKQCSFLDVFLEPPDIETVFNGEVQLEGEIDDECIGGMDQVNFVHAKPDIILIQTDKPFYKAGDLVRCRFFKVDKHLKPPSVEYDFADIHIENTKGIRLFQWKDINLAEGIVQLSFPLLDEPDLGRWSIFVYNKNRTVSQSFEVEEYVLPKFEVTIKHPSFVLANAESFPIRICANYTYGKPVLATLHLNVSFETYSFSRDKTPIVQETLKIYGCYEYRINISLLESNTHNRYRRMMFVANAVEEGTGVQRNKTEFLQLQYQPLNPNFNNDQNYLQYFKPGLPYNGELKVTNPDDTPAEGEPFEISYTVTRERIIKIDNQEWKAMKTIKYSSNFTTDESGIIKYTIPPQSTDAKSIRLEAKSLKYARDHQNSGSRRDSLNQPSTEMTLKPFYSPSGSFIQLATVGGTLPCGSKQNFKLLYTAKESEDENINFKIRYEIRRQGYSMKTGYKHISFNVKDDVSKQFENDDELIDDSETQIDPAPKPTSSSDSDPSDNGDENCQFTKEVKYLPPIGETSIPIEITPSLSSSFYLLIYYVRDDREIVADSRKIEVEKCFKNKVDFEVGDKVKQPGTKTSITVTSSPNSLCGLRLVDKSVSLLNSNNQLTKQKIFQLLERFNTDDYYSENPCNKKTPQPGLYSAKSASIIFPPGRWRSSPYEDSLTSFETAGELVISNLIVFSRPCGNNGYDGAIYQAESFSMNKGHAVALASTARRPAAPAAGGFAADAKIGVADISATKSAVEVRTDFRETWLFELQATGPDGVYVSKETLPDTITEWEGSAVCVNAEDGLGLSNTTSIKGFQAFFISLSLPFSVIRGEIMTVTVSVFNYVTESLPITVTLEKSENFEVIGESVDRDVCIQPDTSKNMKIEVKPITVGKINITVRAETAKSNEICGDSTVYGGLAKDAITQSFECKPEGYPRKKDESILFCPTDEDDQTFRRTFSFVLPEDVVPDSSRAIVDVTGNVMGPAINNLNNLVSLPTGCGEQNMVKFTPNYLVLDYLKDIGQLNEKIKSEAIRNLQKGYQRELNYRHKDGSFSAFGEVDKEGSMFLTAFVMKSFYEAKGYIYIDDSIITGCQNWIVSKQQKDGCFPNFGSIIDRGIQGGLEKEKNTGGITAYVLAALLISKYENQTVIDNALQCLSGDTTSVYETFLYAYAEALAGKIEKAKERIDDARPFANKTDGVEYYKIPNGTQSLELETAAYAVLANLLCGESASGVLDIVRYMSQHFNPSGGFYSTQDTCVGLTALSEFAKLVFKDPVDIAVSYSGILNDMKEINEDNKLLVQRSYISDPQGVLAVTAVGSGCVLIQKSLRYNTKNPPKEHSYYLAAVGKCETLDPDCKIAIITVIIRSSSAGEKAGMTLLQINMVSGFVADKESLDKLKADPKNNIPRIDVENDNSITIYFWQVVKEVKISFSAMQVVEVNNRENGTVKVCDYYSPELTATTSYSFGDSDIYESSPGSESTEP